MVFRGSCHSLIRMNANQDIIARWVWMEYSTLPVEPQIVGSTKSVLVVLKKCPDLRVVLIVGEITQCLYSELSL